MIRFSATVNAVSDAMVTQRSPMEILLIEDNEEEIVMVEEALEETRLPNHMVVAKHPAEALQYLRQCRACGPLDQKHALPGPGLILLDVDMIHHNGLEVLHDLRTDPKLLTIPIVVLTDTLEENQLACTMNHGVTGYFLKPMDAGQLRKVVRDVEEHWQLLTAPPCAN